VPLDLAEPLALPVPLGHKDHKDLPDPKAQLVWVPQDLPEPQALPVPLVPLVLLEALDLKEPQGWVPQVSLDLPVPLVQVAAVLLQFVVLTTL
jgi:hypothetical protein